MKVKKKKPKRRVVLLYCEEAFLGILTPISFFSEAQFQEAMVRLENKECDQLYIALDHFGKIKKAAEKYFAKCIKKLKPELQGKIIISATSKPFSYMFLKHTLKESGNICVDVFAKPKEKRQIEHMINLPVC